MTITIFLFMILPPPKSTLFPYTTLFRSDIAQKLSAEFDLDKLLRNVVDMMFEVMNVDRVTIVLRNETTGELVRSEEHTSELQSQSNLVCRLLLEKKNFMTDFLSIR